MSWNYNGGLSFERHQEIIDLYRGGMNATDIANKMEVTIKTVIIRVNGEGLQFHPDDEYAALRHGCRVVKESDDTRQMREYWEKTNNAQHNAAGDYHTPIKRTKF